MHIGFLGRIFGWRRIKLLVIDALNELQSLVESLDRSIFIIMNSCTITGQIYQSIPKIVE
jgi:hypothetical protein